MSGTVTRHCGRCGTAGTAPEGGAPAGWSFEVDEAGRTVYLCTSCVRANIRAIEGRLPEEYWEF